MSASTIAADGLLKPSDAARFLAIGRTKLWELTAAKDIQVVRIGRQLRFQRSELQAFIERHTVGASKR